MLTPEQISAARQAAGYNPNPATANVPSLAQKIGVANATPQQDTTQKNVATFPATGNETPLGVAAKTVGNIPSSAVNFGKNVIQSINPIHTAETITQIPAVWNDLVKEKGGVLPALESALKEVPGTTYKTLIPQFIQHIVKGDFKQAAATIENDPVGQIAPLLFMARGAATAAGKGAEFDSTISTIAKPITAPIKSVGGGTAKLGTQILGAGTGAGASSVQEAVSAGKAGGTTLDTFTQAMRGKLTPEEIMKSAQDVVQSIKEERSKSYTADLQKIGANATSHDISPILSELNKQLDNFGITKNADGSLDFSRSAIAKTATARNDVQGVYDTLKDWGTKAGDRTGIGLDTLKRQLGDFYSDSSQARAFVQAIKGKVTGILNKEIPGYQKMTSAYQKASNLLDEIKSATGIGTNARPDTVFTKLTTAMKGDKDFRLEVLREMEKTDPSLMDKIAGSNLSSWVPRGLVGRGADVLSALQILTHGINPSMISVFLGTSPRIVGEFMRATGMASSKISQITGALKKLGAPIPMLSPGTIPQENLPQKSQTQAPKKPLK